MDIKKLKEQFPLALKNLRKPYYYESADHAIYDDKLQKICIIDKEGSENSKDQLGQLIVKLLNEV